MKRPPANDLIAVLNAARKHIDKGNRRHICLALVLAADIEPRLSLARDYMRRYVMHQLQGYMSLESWITGTRPGTGGSYRTCRLQWIDWMIASIKETG